MKHIANHEEWVMVKVVVTVGVVVSSGDTAAVAGLWSPGSCGDVLDFTRQMLVPGDEVTRPSHTF